MTPALGKWSFVVANPDSPPAARRASSMFARGAEYRDLVADLQHVLTAGADGERNPGLIARSRAALHGRYGDVRVEVLQDAVRFWPTASRQLWRGPPEATSKFSW